MSDELRQHNELDSIMTEALVKEHPEWSMELVREAALICSNSLIRNANTAFIKADTELATLLDKYSRDIAVSGLKNHGFSTLAQKILKKLQAALNAYILAEVLKAKPNKHGFGGSNIHEAANFSYGQSIDPKRPDLQDAAYNQGTDDYEANLVVRFGAGTGASATSEEAQSE